ncbi:MAG TPA: hypothetical protein DCR14_17945 [Acidimicrobiaceae bacterium]|nr:hypothetical protein [Acidimicrobiaceae bacterium]
MEKAESLNMVERNLQMSAIYEYLQRAANDLRTFRPEATKEAEELAAYAEVVATKASLSRALGSAQGAAVDAAKDVGLAFLKQPTITGLAASGPIALILYWMDVLQGIGEALGEFAGTASVMVGLLSGGALLWVIRYLWMAGTHAANATSRGMQAISSAPQTVKANLRDLDRALTEFMTSHRRAVAEPPVFARAKGFVGAVVVTAAISVAIAGVSAVSGVKKGYDEACRLTPTSKSC